MNAPDTMAPNTPPAVIILTTLLTFAIVTLFAVLSTRAFYRAMVAKDTSAFYRLIYINDSLDRIRTCVANEAASWQVAS